MSYTASSQTTSGPSSQRDDNHLLAVIRSRPAQDAARQEACEELHRVAGAQLDAGVVGALVTELAGA